MTHSLVIVESPAKAKTINGYLGKDFTVIASMGHVRDLPSKNGSVLPDEDFKMVYEVKKESKKHVDNILAKAKTADVIYLASDPDREGEAIAWNVHEILKSKKIKAEVKRATFNEITKKAVNDAIKNAREVDQNLVDAQQARLALDYLVGFEISPILWRKLPGSKSAGRVQSVALRLIAERETEIRKFIPQEYWSVNVDGKFEKNALDIAIFEFNKKRLDNTYPNNKELADKIIESLQSQDYMEVVDLEQKDVRQNPTPPFTTSLLQQEGSKKLGFTSKKTMQVAQKLYEGIDLGGTTKGLITYMRTDGMSLGDDATKSIREYIENKCGKEYLPEKAIVYKTKQKNAQEAHDAIRPTDITITPEDAKKHLTTDEYKLYRLIWMRTVACQMMPAIKTQTRLDFLSQNGDAKGKITGTQIKFDGFLRIYSNKENIEKSDEDTDNDDENLIPLLNKGDRAAIKKVEGKQHFTASPPRYTEATLIKKMEELGIGRPSTYASIITVLQDRLYVRVDKRQFWTEELGIVVSSFLCNFFAKYVEYGFTAGLEEELDLVSNGEMKKLKLLKGFWGDFHKNVTDVMQIGIPDIAAKLQPNIVAYSYPNAEELKCPVCKTGDIKFSIGRKGSFFGCTNYPECTFVSGITGKEGSIVPEMHEADTLIGDDGTVFEIKVGKFGRYAETTLEDGTKKRKSIPANLDLVADREQIFQMINLPRLVGSHTETKEEIFADTGKFGPYIKYAGKFYSIPKGALFSLTISEAVEIIIAKDSGAKPTKAAKITFEHPKGGKITIGKKRGVYCLYNKKFYSIPNIEECEEATLEMALKSIDES